MLRKELLAEIESIAPVLAAHASASEMLGRLDEPTMAALRSTRLLRLGPPRALGGLEADPVTWVIALEALARIDASTSWALGILAGFPGIWGAYLPADTARRLFADSVPPMAGSLLPKGTAEPVPGGYQVKGRWPYGSGIHHAGWVAAGVLVRGKPGPAGGRFVLLPRSQVTIHDNWQVAGLRGSGSSDYSEESSLAERIGLQCCLTEVFMGNAVTGGAALRLGLPAWVASFHIGLALGIARHALDEISTQAVEKGRGFPPSPLPTQPHVQFALGKAEIELASARAYGLQVMGDLYEEAQAGQCAVTCASG